MKNTISEDITEIKGIANNLYNIFIDFREEQRKFNTCIDSRVRTVESGLVAQKERVSNWSFFQTALTAIVGSISTYLGATIRK